MRAERRSYTVAGWGDGELWIGDGIVLANDFRFSPAAGTLPAASASPASANPASANPASANPAAPKGAMKPPSSTVAPARAQVVDGSVTTVRQHVDADDVIARLRAFLGGDAVELSDVPLDLSSSSPFQRSVANALRAVPRGEVVTYGELAALAGRPGAPRAAGTICARNPFSFLLPCHRVVAAHGIGGYGSAGVAVKRRLLALEGVEL